MSERLWDNPVLRAYGVLVAVAAAAVCVVALTGQTWPAAAVNLLLGVPSALLAAAMCRTAYRHPDVTPGAGRFWRTTMIAMLIVGLAVCIQDADFLHHTVLLAAAGNVVQVFGEILFAWPQLRLAIGAATRHESIALWLDVATLVAVVTIFLTHLIVDRAVAEPGPALVIQLVPGGIGLFLLIRLTLGGSRILPPRAMGFLAIGAFVGATLLPLTALLLHWRAGTADMPPWLPTQIIPIVAGLFLALSARCQVTDRALTGRPPVSSRRRSWAPYIAILAVDALLLREVWRESLERRIVTIGAVLLTGFVVVRQIVTFEENAGLTRRLREEATHDALTGLANRVLFARRVAAATARPEPFSLVLIDLDDFKTVNDTLGHAVGDDLLVAVAERMTRSVRPGDTVARLGGDEFAILIHGLTGDAVDRTLVRIAEALLVPVAADNELISVRASFGVADGKAGLDADELLRRADIAMYEAKAGGQGGHQRYTDGMEARGAQRSRLTAAIRTALDEDQFVLFYQPVVALPSGRIIGAEALIRWQHPSRGLLGPHEFVTVAEESGLIVPLGRWVLHTAARQAAEWADALASISVNVAVHQLREGSFADEVAAALDSTGLPPRRLCLEITESTAFGGGSALATMRRLRDMGVRLSLDDFGTGASTLSVLATCPVDQIKLDRSFISGPDAIPQAVLHLARALGVDAVAEGIETEEQAAHLTAMGYEKAQGYLFARPMPAADLTARLSIAH